MYIKVTDEPTLVRDSESKAILNVDVIGLNKYKQERMKAQQIQNMSKDFENFKKEFESTRSELSEIKQLLINLMEKK